MAFNHENLVVYQRLLPFNAKVSTWTIEWDNKHALCDQLSRAAGSMLESRDYVPQNWFAPTSVWLVGRPASDQHALLLPDDLAPGLYRITLRLYEAASGIPVETAAGPDVLLAEIEVYE